MRFVGMPSATGNELYYIATQRGATCAPDSFFTMLEESDVTKPVLDELKDPSQVNNYLKRANILDTTNRIKVPLMKTLARSLRRRQKNRAPPKLARTNSANAGEGLDVLRLISSAGSNVAYNRYGKAITCPVTGTHTSDMLSYAAALLQLDTLGIFHPKGIFIEVSANRFREKDRVFGFQLSIGGHAITIFQRGGVWVLADNEVGVLHMISDNTLIDKMLSIYSSGTEDFRSHTIDFIPSPKNESVNLNYRIFVDDWEYLADGSPRPVGVPIKRVFNIMFLSSLTREMLKMPPPEKKVETFIPMKSLVPPAMPVARRPGARGGIPAPSAAGGKRRTRRSQRR